jgi:hypothetical protein
MPWLPQEGGSRDVRAIPAVNCIGADGRLYKAVTWYFEYLRIHVYIGTLLCVSEGGAASHLHGIGGTRVCGLSDRKKEKEPTKKIAADILQKIPSTNEPRFWSILGRRVVFVSSRQLNAWWLVRPFDNQLASSLGLLRMFMLMFGASASSVLSGSS